MIVEFQESTIDVFTTNSALRRSSERIVSDRDHVPLWIDDDGQTHDSAEHTTIYVYKPRFDLYRFVNSIGRHW